MQLLNKTKWHLLHFLFCWFSMPLKSTNKKNEKAQNFVPFYNIKQNKNKNYNTESSMHSHAAIVVILVELIEVANNEKIFLAGGIEWNFVLCHSHLEKKEEDKDDENETTERCMI